MSEGSCLLCGYGCKVLNMKCLGLGLGSRSWERIKKDLFVGLDTDIGE